MAKTEINYERKTLLVLTGIIFNLIKNHFRLEDDLFFSDDNTMTKITIQPSFKWSPEDCQNRPGIFIKRNAAQIGNPRAGFDDLYHYDISTDENTYAFFVQTSFTVYCISKDPGISELIAQKCFEAITVLSPHIKKDFELMKLIVSQIGPIAQIEESKEFYMIPLTIDVMYNETWVVKALAQKLADIRLTSNFSF